MEALTRHNGEIFLDMIGYILSAIIVLPLAPVYADVCISYKKSVDWIRMLEKTKNSSFYGCLYKSKMSTIYCYTEQYCCGSGCCENKSYRNYYEYYSSYDNGNTQGSYEMSFGGTFGIAIALVVGLTFCLACCISCCKQNQNDETPMSIREVQPIVAYSSSNGTVVVRQAPPAGGSLSSISSNSDREVLRQSSPEQTPVSGYTNVPPQTPVRGYTNAPPPFIQESGREANDFNNTQPSDLTAPPPSYDDVISQNYPIFSESKN
ncbi:uncharacterized protein LOC134244664 [Saccostrea cucullata]|uniref:uncharacterized protein LOC134239420 n=1 Tax=Saccostrea cuccullata TaxID=36930 RepID=UPI002ED516F9